MRTPSIGRRALAVAAAIAVAAASLGLGTAPATAAVTPVPGDPLTGSGAVTRSVLTSAQLASTSAPAATVTNDAFALPAAAAPPAHVFEGTLTLNGVATSGGFTTVKDPYGYAGTAALKHLPPFSVQLVQNGSHLVPVTRGVQITGSPYWNLAVGAGRAWKENGDGGQSRAALPFALVERNANCVHNGVLTFLYTAASVSKVRYQVTSETCEYFQFDLWGQVDASYTPGGITAADDVRNAYAAEVADRLPTKPISALASDYPAAGLDLSAFGGGITAGALSTYGLFYDGTNYVGDCPTRQGAYPFCGQLLLPSYSTAKSAFGGMSMLRLAQKYGTGVTSELVKNQVPEAAGLSAWNGVTIDNALDMATGNYTSADFEADESGSTMLAFFNAESYADKMSAALSFPRKATPGTTWNYHTSDTFLATRAMDGVLKSHAGSGAEIFAMLRDEVLKPAKVGPDALTTLRTGNSTSGAAFGGYGLFWTRDDIAKVAKFLTVDHGAAGGQQILHPGLLDASLQRDPSDRGVTTSGTVPFKYNNAFWARNFTSADDASFSTPFSVPFMSGFGGITVALMPNGSSYYVFSDNNEFAWSNAVVQSNKLAPMAGGGGGGCTTAELLGNGGFETGTAAPWTASAGVIDNRTSLQPPRSGSWKAWLNGFGYSNTETLSQTLTIPANCTGTALRFWLRIDSAETLANPYDTMRLTVTPSGGSATTLAQWSNLDKAGYALKSFPLGAYAGKTITVTFTGAEDYSLQTSFVIDDASVTAS